MSRLEFDLPPSTGWPCLRATPIFRELLGVGQVDEATALPRRDGFADMNGHVTEQRMALVTKAVDDWKRQLVDLTGNNRLIYFRETKTGSLNLEGADQDRVSELIDGKKLRISRLFPTLEEGTKGLDPSMARKRMRTIDRTALANREELGIETLFLTMYRMTWDASQTSKAIPNAPLLMAPLISDAMGGSQSDYELQRSNDWVVNETLLLFWEENFGIQIDRAELDAVVEDNQDSPAAIAQHLRDAARSFGSIKDLKATHGVLLGNFKYQKMPMVRDLESSVSQLAANDLISAIAGDRDAVTALRNANAPGDIDERLPNTVPPENEFLVLDADSSQSYVVNAVSSGRSLVVEGPPGTGKSQTISNLIATLAAQGKSVLFVAEKRAAIEAVHKRLDEVGLGDVSLDLHGTKLKKKELAESLARSLRGVGEASRPKVGMLHGELAQLRGQMVGYEAELHEVHEPWEMSYFEVLEGLASDSATPIVPLPDAVIDQMSDDRQLQAESAFAELRSIERGIDLGSPWNMAALASEQDAQLRLDNLSAVTGELLPDLQSSLAGAEAVVPAVGELTVNEVGAFLGLHDRVVEMEKEMGAGFWALDLNSLLDALLSKRTFLPGPAAYRDAKARLSEIGPLKFRRQEAISNVERAIEIELEWRQMFGEAPERIPVAPILANSHQAFVSGVSTLTSVDIGILDQPVAAAAQLAAELTATDQTAFLLGRSAEVRQTISDLGLAPILEQVDSGLIPEDAAPRVLQISVFEGIRRRIERRGRALTSFDGREHSAASKRYAEADRQHIESAVSRVSRQIAERVVHVRNEYPDQNALVEREAKKKTRHRTLRQLQEASGDVLTALKPCWMMSPLMVAQSLPAKPMFDYVVFDEASQIQPADAISSLLRGRNVVVAGDRRQLPPSAFFGSSAGGDIEDYDEDDDALTGGYESLLDVVGVTLPSRMLNWHYRSNDDRLIALSNDHIYGGSLTTFPGSQQESPIHFHKVDHTPLDNSEVKSNSTEVMAVVNLMLEHARVRPEMSLGVIAFGQAHATAIEDKLQETLFELRDATLDEYFDESLAERVFVKNIERVQGDERDAIILTIGYGHDVSGKVPLRFGPVNHEGGERRINVAASRARSRMDVVSSIESSELNIASGKKGPQLFRDLIRFAETSGEDTGAAAIKNPLNPFELAVEFELRELGLDPIAQYGAAGYRIDFALPHPENDGRMVLAVEADGASYHSSHTARDRDRLRQQVLEAKGWKFHRIWSTAFFRDPKGEALRVKEAYDRAVRNDPDEFVTPFVATSQPPPPPAAEPSKPRLVRGRPITEYRHRELVALARWITSNGELLLTNDEIHERMKAELGFARSGSRIREAFDRAIRDSGS